MLIAVLRVSLCIFHSSFVTRRDERSGVSGHGTQVDCIVGMCPCVSFKVQLPPGQSLTFQSSYLIVSLHGSGQPIQVFQWLISTDSTKQGSWNNTVNIYTYTYLFLSPGDLTVLVKCNGRNVRLITFRGLFTESDLMPAHTMWGALNTWPELFLCVWVCMTGMSNILIFNPNFIVII